MIRHISASRRIEALPAAIYSLIADYHDGHRRIVPPKIFRWLSVDKGGIGDGTEIRFAMRVFGSMRTARGIVTEPQPGRVLVESYPDTGDITTFIVEPTQDAGASSVTITTDLHVADGFSGRLQGFMAERFLRPLYLEELQRLADLAEGRQRHDPVPRQPEA
jgi:Polyketide cyclase / dehydrase and lipid transport